MPYVGGRVLNLDKYQETHERRMSSVREMLHPQDCPLHKEFVSVVEAIFADGRDPKRVFSNTTAGHDLASLERILRMLYNGMVDDLDYFFHPGATWPQIEFSDLYEECGSGIPRIEEGHCSTERFLEELVASDMAHDEMRAVEEERRLARSVSLVS